MKVVILAGGLGSRLSEETHLKPKPMVEIGGHPILWHIMKTYSFYGINDFIVCCGYKGHIIKEYFNNYFMHNSDVTFDLQSNEISFHRSKSEKWKVTLVDTGDAAMTGGRLLAVKEYVCHDELFCFTYGDGLINANISKLIKFHRSHGAIATLTAAHPPARFGALQFDQDRVSAFSEKPDGDGMMINAGYFVLSPKVFDFLDGPQCVWEQGPLNQLTQDKQLYAYKHLGFWHPMDTLADKTLLHKMWIEGKASWKVW